MTEAAGPDGEPARASAPEAPTPFPPYARPVGVRTLHADDGTARLWGRTFPRASGAERLAWCALLVGVLLVLGLATQLSPDPRGAGTHEQIPFLGGHLKPCGFYFMTGVPCPSCGYTTTFALAAHGRFLAAIRNQPFGFAVFLVTCGLVPAALAAAVGKVSWARVSDDWPWKRIVLVTIALWLLAWAYKIEMMMPT